MSPDPLPLGLISVVIPLYNERESLPRLFAELTEGLNLAGVDQSEWIFVDDGSTDGSWDVIEDLARSEPRVRAIRFRRNFGKAAALSAGFLAARGDLVFTLDADLQDDPAEMGRFLSILESGRWDVLSGWKKVRYDPWHKVYPSRVFNWMVSTLTGCRLHDHNCGYKLYRAEVVREVRIYGELHRFVPALAHARGFRVGEIEVRHRPRRHGASKYGVGRFLKGFLDLLTVRFLTRFRQRPSHVLGGLGLLMLVLGLFGMTELAIEWLLGYRPIGNRPFLVYSAVALGIGVQLLSLGILAELVTAFQVQSLETYSIAERLEPPDSATCSTTPHPPTSSSD